MSISAVLLGAGLSRRFGSDKMEAKLGGERLVDVACGHFLEAGFSPVVFVGSARPRDRRVRRIEPEVSTPQMIETLRIGLRAVPEGPFCFAPADMPALFPPLLRRLAGAFEAGGEAFLVPVYAGRRGHPAFARETEPFFSAGDREGAREVFRAAGNDLRLFEVDTADVLFDVDTPKDLLAAPKPSSRRARLLERGTLPR